MKMKMKILLRENLFAAFALVCIPFIAILIAPVT